MTSTLNGVLLHLKLPKTLVSICGISINHHSSILICAPYFRKYIITHQNKSEYNINDSFYEQNTLNTIMKININRAFYYLLILVLDD